MSDRRTTPTPDTNPQEHESLSGHSWPVVPLLIAFLLLRMFPDRTWAYVCAAVIGGLGALAALYGITQCVKAAREHPTSRRSAAGMVLVLLAALANWARHLF